MTGNLEACPSMTLTWGSTATVVRQPWSLMRSPASCHLCLLMCVSPGPREPPLQFYRMLCQNLLHVSRSDSALPSSACWVDAVTTRDENTAEAPQDKVFRSGSCGAAMLRANGTFVQEPNPPLPDEAPPPLPEEAPPPLPDLGPLPEDDFDVEMADATQPYLPQQPVAHQQPVYQHQQQYR